MNGEPENPIPEQNPENQDDNNELESQRQEELENAHDRLDDLKKETTARLKESVNKEAHDKINELQNNMDDAMMFFGGDAAEPVDRATISTELHPEAPYTEPSEDVNTDNPETAAVTSPDSISTQPSVVTGNKVDVADLNLASEERYTQLSKIREELGSRIINRTGIDIENLRINKFEQHNSHPSLMSTELTIKLAGDIEEFKNGLAETIADEGGATPTQIRKIFEREFPIWMNTWLKKQDAELIKEAKKTQESIAKDRYKEEYLPDTEIVTEGIPINHTDVLRDTETLFSNNDLIDAFKDQGVPENEELLINFKEALYQGYILRGVSEAEARANANNLFERQEKIFAEKIAKLADIERQRQEVATAKEFLDRNDGSIFTYLKASQGDEEAYRELLENEETRKILQKHANAQAELDLDDPDTNDWEEMEELIEEGEGEYRLLKDEEGNWSLMIDMGQGFDALFAISKDENGNLDFIINSEPAFKSDAEGNPFEATKYETHGIENINEMKKEAEVLELQVNLARLPAFDNLNGPVKDQMILAFSSLDNCNKMIIALNRFASKNNKSWQESVGMLLTPYFEALNLFKGDALAETEVFVDIDRDGKPELPLSQWFVRRGEGVEIDEKKLMSDIDKITGYLSKK